MNIYHPSNSIFHYMHGFTKIVIFGLFLTVLPFFLGKTVSLNILLLLNLAMLIYVRPTRFQMLMLIPVLSLTLVMGVTFLLADMGGTVYFAKNIGVWDFYITENNVHYALIFMLRMFNCSLSFFLIMFTTKPQDIVNGLEMFGFPNVVTLALSLTLRYWSLMITDARNVMDAQYCRGVDFRSGSIFSRIIRFASILIPIIYVMLKRFRTASFALSLKGVGRKNSRSQYYRPKMSSLDYGSLVVCGICAILLTLLKFGLPNL
ncbi:energy-coupling factor transporter transmembrane component T family protein [Metabacillus arenae]|uniref:Energy-coupling factor transporter transmembrane protein EcfT n=1 Tax=Metabacillus arenae TaxID=2771434 RepID=A0A926RY10_9BACI|nr:energy-coupling factor transporter transmembrane component T [Metabacillus arenae]MBD1382458.1 energy-coupling factor transporter transmembrane protein EcfT [Metabacillus arenae]